MCDKAILENGGTLINKCVINLLIITLMYYNLFLNAIRVKKCMVKLLILIFLQYNLFLNAVRLKKCVIKQFIYAFFVFDSIPDQFKTQ